MSSLNYREACQNKLAYPGNFSNRDLRDQKSVNNQELTLPGIFRDLYEDTPGADNNAEFMRAFDSFHACII